jgi:hypothetical protein
VHNSTFAAAPKKSNLSKPILKSAVLYLQIYTAMRITITEPLTDTAIDLDAEPEDYNGEQGWRIIYPSKDSFVIVHKDGEWNVMDDEDINPEIIEKIGQALYSQVR